MQAEATKTKPRRCRDVWVQKDDRLAQWLEQSLGVSVPEMELPQHQALKAQASLF